MDPSTALKGRTRETKIRRDAAGRWYDDGVEITHRGLTRAFDAWLRPAPDGSGRWCLSNDINWAFVALEGPPRFVREARAGDDGVRLTLSDGEEVALDPRSLRRGPDDALYCDVPGPMTARFDSHAMIGLAPLVAEDDAGVFLTVAGERYRPPQVDDPLRAR